MISTWFYTSGDSGTGLYRIEIEENKITSIPNDDVDNGIRIPFRLEINTDWHKKGINKRLHSLYFTFQVFSSRMGTVIGNLQSIT